METMTVDNCNTRDLSVKYRASILSQECEKLVELANEAGGYDNITVILVEK